MRQVALVTGASRGIGMEFAGIFAREGYDVVLVARDADRLGAVAGALRGAYGTAATVLPLDLTAPGAPEALVGALRSQGIEVDVLVSNAGIGAYGSFAQSDVEQLRSMLRLNVVVPTVLARLLLPAMLERGRGGIINVASVASFVPGPGMAAYYATKAHLLSLSQGLSEEVRGTGVRVTALCPGPTATEFFTRAGASGSRLVRSGGLASAQAVAEQGFAAWRQGRGLVVAGWRNRLAVFASRFLPRAFLARTVARVQAPGEQLAAGSAVG